MIDLLAGVRVVESSMLLNGATTSMHLADLGAEVIKIESPYLGDYLRFPATAHMHFQANKNKRSLALDMRSEGGREVFQRLLAFADVFVTNAVADRNRKLGLDYETLSGLKPDLVYCQNTGFGATGPYRNMPAHGQMMDALAGALPVEIDDDGLTRLRTGPRNGRLTSGGEATATGAVYAAFHVAAALTRREKTGRGAYIDVSSAEAVVANAWVAAVLQANTDQGRAQQDPAAVDASRGVARYQWYQTRDGLFVLFCPEEKKFWHTFCDVVGRADLKDQVSGLELRRTLQEIFWTRDRAEWVALAVEHRIPVGPTNDTVDEVRADPQISSRHIFVDGQAPDNRHFVYVGQPALVDGGWAEVRRVAPELGKHTDAILGEIGYSDAEIARLAADHVTTSPEFHSDHIASVGAGTAGADKAP